jgi:glycosyltransferase involved in cell wall biosynthesis
MEEIAALSDCLIVMSKHSSRIMQEVFRVPEEKITLIPHGVPDLPFGDTDLYKDSTGTKGKVVLLTLGLLSPNKGIERVIEALPRIVADHPEVVYVIVGATHPHIRQREGDRYRLQLQSLAKTLGVERNVIFHNRFVSPEEMAQFVGSADIYITPYPYEAQAVPLRRMPRSHGYENYRRGIPCREDDNEFGCGQWCSVTINTGHHHCWVTPQQRRWVCDPSEN